MSAALAEPFELVAWNIESGDSSISWVAGKVRDFSKIELWGLSEVPASASAALEVAAEDSEQADFSTVLGTTGGADRLLVIYSTKRFDFLGSEELHDINIGGSVRAPLVVKLREKSSGQEFFFMVNHLYRSNAQARHRQSTLINEWAARQTVPTVTVGDFNYDWEVVGGDTKHDKGYDYLTANGVFRWVRPAKLVRTQFGSSYNGVLDFVFVSSHGSSWSATSSIVVEPGDEPDDNVKSDHRPVWASFDFAPSAPMSADALKQRDREILQRLEAIEREIQELKRLLQPLP